MSALTSTFTSEEPILLSKIGYDALYVSIPNETSNLPMQLILVLNKIVQNLRYLPESDQQKLAIWQLTLKQMRENGTIVIE
ncbi:hypothetical protein KC640_02535, partial [Candidatus Dojkabacteria bacterium]|nr:hypothetical protein [Candidatus Dojkabacteria bacterium]